jgi:hypothetical protein
MVEDARSRSDHLGDELLEGTDGVGPRVTPVSVAPVSRMRSPIMEHRLIVPLPPRDDRPTVLLPPLRAFIGPSAFALLAAAPALLVAGLQVALIFAVVAPALRELHRRASRATFSFGEGFIPYPAQLSWPKGVQEDDEVRWNWSPLGNGGARQ